VLFSFGHYSTNREGADPFQEEQTQTLAKGETQYSETFQRFYAKPEKGFLYKLKVYEFCALNCLLF